MAEAGDGRVCQDRANGVALDGFRWRRESGSCRLPASQAFAAGRLPVCLATVDPASDAVSAVRVPEPPWHLAPAGCRRPHAKAPDVEELPYCRPPDRLRRGAGCGGQALSLCRHRPGRHVRRRPTPWAVLQHRPEAVRCRGHTIRADQATGPPFIARQVVARQTPKGDLKDTGERPAP